MTNQGYTESELVANRASLLLFGGGAGDRRAWAEEAHQPLAHEGPLREVTSGAEIDAVVAMKGGVVYVPDVSALNLDDQGKLVRLLQEHEERPKLVLALPVPPAAARDAGKLREDLLYRLSQAQVDLSPGELKQVIRERRERAAKRAEKLAPKTPAKKPAKAPVRKASRPARPAVKTAARRPRPAVKKAASKGKARPVRPVRTAKKAKKR